MQRTCELRGDTQLSGSMIAKTSRSLQTENPS